ncbi:MAG: LPS translocon maturation chaperone LptM [Limnohabitans sp.]
MLKVKKILVTPLVLAGSAAVLSACGQKGPLYAPNAPLSTHRATLPQSLSPWHTPSAVPAAGPAGPAKPAAAAPRATPAIVPDTLFLTSPSASDAATP